MPERRLVDTSVLSLVLKRDTRAAAYVPHLAGRVGMLSFITLAELYRWPEERDWGPRRRAELARLLEPYEVAYPDEASAAAGRAWSPRCGGPAARSRSPTRGSRRRRCTWACRW